MNELRALPATLLPALLLAALLAAGSVAGTSASVHDEPPQQLVVTPAR